MYNVCTLTRFLTIHHYVFQPITRQQIFTFNSRLRTERSAKIRAPSVKAQFRLIVWRRDRAEGLPKGTPFFWHCSSLSGNFVFHLRWFFQNRLLAAQIAQIPHCAAFSWLRTLTKSSTELFGIRVVVCITGTGGAHVSSFNIFRLRLFSYTMKT
jgi:hypothetical protein